MGFVHGKPIVQLDTSHFFNAKIIFNGIIMYDRARSKKPYSEK